MRYVVCVKRANYNPLTVPMPTVAPSLSYEFTSDSIQAYDYESPETPVRKFLDNESLLKVYPALQWVFLDFESDLEAWNAATPPNFIKAPAI